MAKVETQPHETVTITRRDELDAAAARLARLEPRFGEALSVTGPLTLRSRADGFPALLRSVVSQQVSTAAAAAILARVEAAGLDDEDSILAASDDALRAVGVSRQKAGYLRGIAAASLDYLALREEPNDVVVERLVALPGIGRWTAEIYVMFALGRADAFAAGDLGLQHGARLLFDLPERPKERELREMAEAWSPWRAVAARILWAYYDTTKRTDPTG